MHQPMIIWADKQIGYRLYNAPMMIWQHNKMDILSNSKAILIPGRLEKTVPPLPRDSIPLKIMPNGSWDLVAWPIRHKSKFLLPIQFEAPIAPN